MNQDQVLSGVRWVLSTGGTYLATKGYISGDTAVMVVGFAAPVASFIWSFFVHKA